MAEFGLTLPDNDLTAAEFKDLARRLGRAAFTPLFLKLYERVITSEATIEEQRKVLSDISRWTGVEEDKKLDPNANLPVFNIVFGAPAAGRASVEVLDVTPAPAPTALPVPDEDLPVFGGLATNAAFRDLAHKVMTPPEAQDAEPQASPSATQAESDAAEVVRALDAADASLESAGSGAPDTPSVLRPAEQGVRRLRAVAPVPPPVSVRAAPVAEAPPGPVPQAGEGIARDHGSLEESLKGLDSILGI